MTEAEYEPREPEPYEGDMRIIEHNPEGLPEDCDVCGERQAEFLGDLFEDGAWELDMYFCGPCLPGPCLPENGRQVRPNEERR